MRTSARTIALDTTYSVGENLSGVGIYSREIADHLARAHPESRFLFCYRPHRFLRSLKIPQSANVSRRLLWKEWPSRFDVFHGLNQRLDRKCAKSIATFHDLFVLTGDYSSPEFRERFAAQARDAAERADLIIAVSQFTAEQVAHLLKVEHQRIRVIPHGVHVLPAMTELEREPVVLFLGAVQKRKNVARLIHAFEHMRAGWRLVIAGSLGYAAGNALEAVQASPRRNDITLMGYISDKTRETLYRTASIFAFPSLDEGFGIPVLEAMARALPVLTSNRSALPEVAGDAALLVDPEDTDAITAGLDRLACDETLRAELVRRGLRRSSFFTWEKAAGATWNVYQELLAPGS